MENIFLITFYYLYFNHQHSTYCYHLPFLAGILAYRPPNLGSYLMRATVSCSYEGLVAPALSGAPELGSYSMRATASCSYEGLVAAALSGGEWVRECLKFK